MCAGDRRGLWVRSRHRSPASRSGRIGSDEAGPAANNPSLRAVLRRLAPSAPRQRTLEANGIDCGASSLSLARAVRLLKQLAELAERHVPREVAVALAAGA